MPGNCSLIREIDVKMSEFAKANKSLLSKKQSLPISHVLTWGVVGVIEGKVPLVYTIKSPRSNGLGVEHTIFFHKLDFVKFKEL